MRVRLGSTVAAVVVAQVVTDAVSIPDHHVSALAPAVHKVQAGCARSTDARVRVLLLKDLELVAQIRHLLVDLFLLLFRGFARVNVFS